MSEENNIDPAEGQSVKNSGPNRDDFIRSFDELKSLITDSKDGKHASAVNVEKTIDTFMSHVDDSQKVTLANQKELQQKQDEKNAEMNERLDHIETISKRQPTGIITNESKASALAAVNSYAQKRFENLSAEEHKTLRTDSAEDGGVLIPIELSNIVRERREEISRVRSIVDVQQVGAKTLEVAVRTSVPTAVRVGEQEEDTLDSSTYEVRQITNHACAVTVPVTRDMLIYRLDTERMLNRDVAIGMAKKEGAELLNGSGANQAEGILTNTEIPTFNSGIANDVDLKTLIQLPGQLKALEEVNNPIYAMNRRTFHDILSKQATGSGEFHFGTLFQPGNVAAQIPSLLIGHEFVWLNDMPDVDAGKVPILFGDFREAYTLYEVEGLEMIRDPFTKKRKRLVEFTFTTWWTGHVVIPDALVKYVIAT